MSRLGSPRSPWLARTWPLLVVAGLVLYQTGDVAFVAVVIAVIVVSGWVAKAALRRREASHDSGGSERRRPGCRCQRRH